MSEEGRPLEEFTAEFECRMNRPGNSGDPLVCIWTPPFMQQYMY